MNGPDATRYIIIFTTNSDDMENKENIANAIAGHFSGPRDVPRKCQALGPNT